MITQMEEYYIRKEGDEDSRGPFTLDQLSSLVEAEQVDQDTFYYEATTEKWVQISTDQELVATLFPEKKKLKVKPKESISTLNIKREDDKPILVDHMLAAAEGRTAETSDKRDPTAGMARAAMWGMRFGSLILILSSAALLITNMEAVASVDVVAVLTNPFTIFGLIDLVSRGDSPAWKSRGVSLGSPPGGHRSGLLRFFLLVTGRPQSVPSGSRRVRRSLLLHDLPQSRARLPDRSARAGRCRRLGYLMILSGV